MKKDSAPGAQKKQKKRSSAFTWILVGVLVAGIAIIAYPTVSDWWNSYHQSRAIASYSMAVENADSTEMDAMIESAREFNAGIRHRDNVFVLSEGEKMDYARLLDLSGTGVMGYIQINAIGVSLPIYHTTEESVLQVAIGHLDWTSLPVGGPSTHVVLSGHRGLPSAKLFSDLDKLAEGDTFTITVLNTVLTYQVDQIRIVLPAEVDELQIIPEEDLCTLVTCTPYGVNTHRLLVRGHRIENIPGEVVVTAGGVRIPPYIVAPAVGVPLLFLVLLGMLIYYSRKPKKHTQEEILEELKEAACERNDELQERPESDDTEGGDADDS